MAHDMVNPDRIIDITVYITQNGKPVNKQVFIKLKDFIAACEERPYNRWAEVYERIVKNGTAVKIIDKGFNN